MERAGWYADSVRAAFAPPIDQKPSEWAEQHRVLTRRQSSRPGPWRNANQPPAAVLMDLCVRRTIRELWIMKAGQIGVSELIRNVIAYWAVREPDPILLVLPTEKDGRRIVRKRIIPLFEDTPCLVELATEKARDKKLTAITLSNGFDLQLAWGGSPASLASDPARRVILDEVDKYDSSGVEASPVSLAKVRVHTYEQSQQSLIIALSTPTIEGQPIALGFNDCPVKLYFFGHCPHCGRAQRFTFARLKWESFKELPTPAERGARIRRTGAAWFECEGPSCGKRIVEDHKRAIVSGGYFGTEDGGWKLYCDGREEGQQPEDGDKVGVHYSGEIDYQETWANLAALFVEADKRPDKLQDLYNSKLGLPWAQQVESAKFDVYAAKCRPNAETGFIPPKAKVVPAWASRLVMTIDTQKDYFWFVIRAWGYGFRSQRIHHGRAMTFEELEQLYYHAYWPYEGDKYPALRCFGSAPLGIDSGGGVETLDATRTDEVYQWCLKDRLWRWPLKGASKPFEAHIRASDIQYQDPTRRRDPYPVTLHLLDPIYWRDLLSGYVSGRIQVVDPKTGEVTGDVDQWALNDLNDDEYNRHLSAVHKTRKKSGKGHVDVWQPKTPGARHDYHDLESYQLAWAHGPAKCFALPSAEQMTRAAMASQSAGPPVTGGIRMPDGRSFLASRR